MVVLEILQSTSNIIFLVFSIIGIIASLVLLKSPDTFFKIDKILNRRYEIDDRGSFIDTKVDIEYLFFNHHVMTASLMIILSAILFIFNNLVDINKMDISKWIILFAFFKYFFYFFAVLGFGFGFFMLISPFWAFIFLRFINSYIITLTTDDIEHLLENDLVERKMYLKYHVIIAIVMFILSTLLCYFLVSQMFF